MHARKTVPKVSEYGAWPSLGGQTHPVSESIYIHMYIHTLAAAAVCRIRIIHTLADSIPKNTMCEMHDNVNDTTMDCPHVTGETVSILPYIGTGGHRYRVK